MTRVNNKLKLLIMLGFMLLVLLVFNTNNVKAYTFAYIASGTPTSNSLDSISNTLTVDVKTTKLETIEDIIYKQVKSVLKSKNIIVEDGVLYGNDYTISIQYGYIGNDYKYNIDKCTVKIIKENNEEDEEGNAVGNTIIAQKDISIKYTNVGTYNEKDKVYVANLMKKIPKRLYLFDGFSSQLSTLHKIVNDDSISFVYTSGSGGAASSIFNQIYGSACYAVYKDGVYYQDISFGAIQGHITTIPNNIEDTEEAYIKYAIPKLQEYVSNWTDPYTGIKATGKVTKVKKISGYYYNVYLDNNTSSSGIVVIKKAEGTPVGHKVFVDNLQEGANVMATVEANETMENELKNKGYNNILGSYELKLTGATKLTSQIDVTFSVGTEHNNKQVYVLHQKQDGTYENFEKKVADGKVTVTVSELSPFVLALKENTTPSTQEPSTNKPAEQPKQDEVETPKTDDSKPDTTTNKPHIKDETPKTGSDNIVTIVSSIVCVLSIVGIAIIKKF